MSHRPDAIAAAIAGLMLATPIIAFSQSGSEAATAPGFVCLGNDVPVTTVDTVRATIAALRDATEVSFTETYRDFDLPGRVVHADGQIMMIERSFASPNRGELVERFFYDNDTLVCGETRFNEPATLQESGGGRPGVIRAWIAAGEAFRAERNGEPLGDGGLAYADEMEGSAYDSYDRFASAVAGSDAESRYMPLTCEDMIETYEANMGGAFACGTMAGYEVHLIEVDLRQALRLIRDDEATTMWIPAPGFTRFGPMLEWRGVPDEGGNFDPEALIVRAFIDQGDGTEEQRLVIGRLWGARPCFDAWVPVAGNPDHNEDARLLADSPPLYLIACDPADLANDAPQKVD